MKIAIAKKKNLTPQQLLFVKEYLKDLNAHQATLRAGYKDQGYVQSQRLLGNVRIAAAISKEFQERTKKIEINVEDVLRGLSEIANANVADAYDANGCIKNIHDMPIALQRAISSIEVDEIWEFVEPTSGGRRKIKEQIGETKKIRFWEKTKSFELLGKYLAMFIERNRFEDKNGDPLPPVTVQFVGVVPGQQEASVPSGLRF